MPMAVSAYAYRMSAHILVTGEDAADFLQSQFSNDLRPFSKGQVTYGLWLDVKGKVIADSWVRCEGEAQFRILSEHCPGREIADKLDQHIVADDVELEVLPAAPALTMIGPDGHDKGISFQGRRSLQPSCEVVFGSDAERDGVLSSGDYEIVSENWIQKERIRAGIPLVPQEIGPADLPGEGGMENDALSFNKGCFLGQEVAARMHNVGRAQRALFVVTGSGEAPTVPSSLQNAEGKAVGALRSAYARDGGWLGVAMLKIRHVEPGAGLLLEDAPVTVEGSLRKDS